MKPIECRKFLGRAIKKHRRVLVKSAPGAGKTDIWTQACADVGAKLVLMHPAISDPTDFKGMPYVQINAASAPTEAVFLPFNELAQLMNAVELTVCLFDDIGQAPNGVQAALMQLVLAGELNGMKISTHVVFGGATNNTKDLAGVSGMIEPLKSRWHTIITLEASVDDWRIWAQSHGMPAELVAFLRFRPALLHDFKPTREITNSPCPRNWASVGQWLNDGETGMEVFAGAVGEGAATEFWAFMDTYKSLPSISQILLDPAKTPVPDDKPAALFAVSTALARAATEQNLDRVMVYGERMPKDFEVMMMRDVASLGNIPGIAHLPVFIDWSDKNKDVLGI